MDKQKYTEILKQQKLVDRKPEGSLVCKRCVELKGQNKLIHYNPLDQKPGGKFQTQVSNLSSHVTSFDRPKIINDIFKQIYAQSIILYVIDILNFEGSQIQEIYDLINEKHCRVLIIVNKIDALPNSFKTRAI